MTDTKPVAYMDKDGTLVNETTHPEFYTYLYTADSLRAAQVQVLKTALQSIEGLIYKDECEVVIRMMLTDLREAGK